MNSLIEKYQLSEAAIDSARRFLQAGAKGLQFEPELETAFEHYHIRRYLFVNRVYPLLGALVLAFFSFADSLIIPEKLSSALTLRFLGVGLVILIVGLSRFEWIIRRYQMLLCLGAIGIHLILLGISSLASNLGEQHYQNGTILSVFFACAVLRIQFHYIFPFALLMWFSQVMAMHFFMTLPPTQFTEMLFIQTFVVLISLLVSFRVEFETRKNFLQQLILFHDQAELRNTQEELKRLSLIDQVTGIPNRRHFDDVFSREWSRAKREGQPLAVIMVDVDNFKKYNDLYGHPMGDQCLTRVAETLTVTLRRAGDLVTRFGGEEFAVILANCDEEGAADMATRMVEVIRAARIPHEGSETGEFLSISAGYSTMTPTDGKAKEDLIKQADLALYNAKNKGKNRAESFSA